MKELHTSNSESNSILVFTMTNKGYHRYQARRFSNFLWGIAAMLFVMILIKVAERILELFIPHDSGIFQQLVSIAGLLGPPLFMIVIFINNFHKYFTFHGSGANSIRDFKLIITDSGFAFYSSEDQKVVKDIEHYINRPKGVISNGPQCLRWDQVKSAYETKSTFVVSSRDTQQGNSMQDIIIPEGMNGLEVLKKRLDEHSFQDILVM